MITFTFKSITKILISLLRSDRMSQRFLNHRWDWVGSLPEERQWGPAVGLVAGIPVIATGKNYGDVTLEELDNSGMHFFR